MDNANIANLIVSGTYFVLTGGLTLFSLFAVFVLLRYGQSRIVSFLVSALYVAFFLSLLSQSYQTLISLK